MNNKAILREKIINVRKSLTLEEKIKKDIIIKDKLQEISLYKESNFIFIYVSLRDEVNTHAIIKEGLKHGKRICVPKVISIKEGMVAIEIKDFSELIECGQYKILEPKNFENIVDPKKIDLAILPGLAFDNKGGRLGYGGGFYDRFIPKLKKGVPKIALAYDFQILKEVPKDVHDILVDEIIIDF
ncbi:5-formyltetrahydrofolate cyclo-ligase [Clostridium sporogenes]|uniref:5-formyltetrahydrofolate cyclo-ligase n=1 Tax=Clostridium sporogenes TaxID=1509 RepID=UPI0029022577|nr:5-formyltetrahydrofolate cyclo-ligase [Clostridium botulinum]